MVVILGSFFDMLYTNIQAACGGMALYLANIKEYVFLRLKLTNLT